MFIKFINDISIKYINNTNDCIIIKFINNIYQSTVLAVSTIYHQQYKIVYHYQFINCIYYSKYIIFKYIKFISRINKYMIDKFINKISIKCITVKYISLVYQVYDQ